MNSGSGLEYLKDILRSPMHRLLGNLMSNNFACLNQGGVKLTVWRLSFDHRAVGAMAHVLAQVICLLKMSQMD